MKNKKIAKILLITLFTTLTINEYAFSLDNNQRESVNTKDTKISQKHIKNGKINENTDSVKHVRNKNEINDTKPNIDRQLKSKPVSIRKADQKYTMDDLQKMSYRELGNILLEIKWNDITDLFQYSEGARAFYSDEKRMDYIINLLKERGHKFTKDDTAGIPTIIEVLRSGFYLGFYNDGLKELNKRAYQDKCIPAILEIQKNPNFALGTSAQDEIVAAVGILVSNASSNAEVVNNFMPVLTDFKNNFVALNKDRGKQKAIYNIIDGVKYDIEKYAFEKQGDYSNSIWSGKIDKFIDFISDFALKGDVDSENEWIINGCLYYIDTCGKVYSKPQEGLRVLTEGMKRYPYLGEQYLQCASSIGYSYGSKDYYGKSINVTQIKEEGLNKYLPKQYKFDDGKVVVKTGDKVTEEKVKRLYWASKEVQAQFFRAIGTDKPLEQGNKDDILTIVIYNSPKEYEMNRLLKGLDVKNGGIYIEGDGTFYTYERKPEESIYTLEELFRHEFTHYLQGRYLVPGLWGSSKLYQNDRLTWLEEGGAELFAGSTRTNDVLPRKSVVSNIVNTEADQRYSVDKTMHSKYGSFEFYHYGFMVQDYMYEKDIAKLNELYESIKNNNVDKYDSLISKYSNDAALENNYRSYMDSLVNKYDSLTTPLVSDDYIKVHKTKANQEIFDDITRVAQIQNVKTEINKSPFFNLFSVRGTYNGGKSQGKFNDIRNIDKKLNETLNTLNDYEWSGYKTVTAYMVNYNVDSNNNVTWELVFNGISNENIQNNDTVSPIVNIKSEQKVKVNEKTSFNSEVTLDTGKKVVEYNWDFGDGLSSNEKNPQHSYSKIGNYKVTLTVKDDAGLSGSNSVYITAEDIIKPTDPVLDSEVEPNDTFETANGPLKNKTAINGTIKDSESDMFYFDLPADGAVDINLINKGNNGIAWLLYNSSDNSNYIAYPSERANNSIKGTAKLTKGRYYVVAYGYGRGASNYSLEVKWNGSPETPKIKEYNEKEYNDSFENANSITVNNSLVKGSLSQTDRRDSYEFEITKEGNLDIDLTKGSNDLGVAWNLYSENDLTKYMSYGHRDGNKITNKVHLKPGKYYLVVYSYEGTGNYTVQSKFN
ncbi:microbial collagenase [Clostridium cavendishii DSM 21758]|uniref:microbial collagenase n=1 Tax=Clostridium cavendishii DSM 21758 TaxID=1121302 RepID=A0A1M6QEU6_9CLOT|nr:collagenase [Clostridium cavendishii]SHK18834.1 microbial collagenase [Clostridium cavendishii DSM 21758]